VSPPIHHLTISQGAVFLINSCQGYFRCGPYYYGQALFRSYGCFFAEFLEDLSLVRLGLLDQITCVGLRYGSTLHILRRFSRKAIHRYLSIRRLTFCLFRLLCIADFPTIRIYRQQPKSNYGHLFISSVSPSIQCEVMEY
jgi:hypothetical protein